MSNSPRRPCWRLLLAVVGLLLTQTGQGAIVRYTGSGTLARLTAQNADGSAATATSSIFKLGRPFYVTFSYDTATPPFSSGSGASYRTGDLTFNYDRGTYRGTGTAIHIEVRDGAPVQDHLVFWDFTVTSGFGPVDGMNFDPIHWSIAFVDSAGRALASESLPPRIELADFPSAAGVAVEYRDAVGKILRAEFDFSTLSVPSAPVIVTHPQSRTCLPGETFALSVSATGTPEVEIQWLKDGVPVAGATSATFMVDGFVSAMVGDYCALVSNDYGVLRSEVAHLSLAGSPLAGAYAGTLDDGGQWAMQINSDATGSFLAFLPSSKQAVIGRYLSVRADGGFSFGANTPTASSRYYDGPVAGAIANGAVTGRIAGLGRTFTGTFSAGSSTHALAGIYQSVSLGTALGVTHVLAAPDGTLLMVTIDATAVAGGRGTLAASNSFAIDQPNFTASGTLDPGILALTATCRPAGSRSLRIVPQPFPRSASDRLVNVSTRGYAGSGSDTLIAGFVISGTAPRTVLIRGIGPMLGPMGVTRPLANPHLSLFHGGTALAENDDWSQAANAADIAAAAVRLGGFALPEASLDSAMLVQLEPGVYTTHVTTSTNSPGVALLEIYDASTLDNDAFRVVNLSSRGNVGRGENAFFVGFVINGTIPRKVLVRGVGPLLSSVGVLDAMADPALRLQEGGTILCENDNWSDGADSSLVAAAARATGATTLTKGSKDAALLVYLPPGAYTAIVSGVGDTTGVALVEVYEVP